MSEEILKEFESHEENRDKVCLFCFKVKGRTTKTTFTKILPSGKLELLINTYFPYSVTRDDFLPKSVCSGCLREVYRKNISKPDVTQFPFSKTTRSSGRVLCICIYKKR